MKDRRLTIELVLDNVGTWKAIKPGKQQHGQLGKHQLGTHKPNTWAGGTREAITISRPPHCVGVLEELPRPNKVSETEKGGLATKGARNC